MSNLVQISKIAGVSRATVARAFSSPEQVKLETRERIYQVAKTLGFRPNYAARQLRTQSSKMLGVMLPTLDNPIFSGQLEAMEKMAREHDYSLLVATTEYDPQSELEVLENMLRQRVDGLILTVANAQQSDCLNKIKQESIPTVLTHNPVENTDFITISIDNYAAMYDATQRLIQYGHNNIAMITGPFFQSDRSALRYQGYADAMTAAGLTALPVVEMQSHTQVQIDTLLPLLKQNITALLCSNDLLALSSIGNLQRLGYLVPEHISVVGFDGIALGKTLYPALSSVAQPRELLGWLSVKTLLQMISGQTVTSQTLCTQFNLEESMSNAPQTTSITHKDIL
ncbi:LacI family DNA-binding transcriptional regulator [Acinetobacter boissieri]|uniref:Transcriptional regulator, LacI family n=1 Tax=Acinetobacter boissieri TaxID=1219383 RepID=A0A1G6H3B2_9GAMM|nr:substrate-binding domain-containing protein [Acinetobacter boissieri]SDB87916.1 transcriptional regulator, LacI family [Acinetobacter boissieri]